jgi:D-ribose pyranase
MHFLSKKTSGETQSRNEVALKKTGLLNQELSAVVAGMGHMDMLVVCDAGLPIPAEVRRIDLAVRPGLPCLVEILAAIATELQVERLILAKETGEVSPHVEDAILHIFKDAAVEKISHEQFKGLTHKAVAVIRSGEFTPYANVILVSGVVF